MTLSQIAAVCNGQLINASNYDGREAAGFVLDSRLVQNDYIFIATVGERVDGHDFINDVYAKGALAVICERIPTIQTASPSETENTDTELLFPSNQLENTTGYFGPYILVENSLVALRELAAWYRRQLHIKVVGITGSVGKTSTKEFISSVLSQRYQVLKTEGNYNNEIGLPLTILNIRDEHEVAVLEMGISDFGEMHRLSYMAKPDVAVITNIGQCHLEKLGSRQGVLKAKSEIFDYLNEDGAICLNGDDDLLATIQEVRGIKPIRFGINSPGTNDIYATDIENLGLFGSSCRIHVDADILSTRIPLPGGHMVLNALAATAVGKLLSLTMEEIKAGIEAVKPTGGRSNIIRHGKQTIIDDCYNANPVSMKAALDLLSTADTRRVAILGDMFELGASEHLLHHDIGNYAASKGTEVLVCVGKLSLNMYEGAKATNSLCQLYYYETRDESIMSLPNILQENDTILVKASHGMGFDKIVKALQL